MTGCGARVAPASLAQHLQPATHSAVPTAATPTTAPDSRDAPATATAGSHATEGPTGPAPTPTYDFDARHNTFVKIALSAQCVWPTAPLTITITGGRNSGVAAIVAFSDDSPHGHMIAGETDGSGRYVWPTSVALDAPPGPASVWATVAGDEWEGENAGTADAKFRVVQTPEECG